MKWNDYPENKPSESGQYLVSITRPYIGGNDYTFKYIAYFNTNTNRWHKYDSFVNENEILEIIEYKINGWFSGIPIYLR